MLFRELLLSDFKTYSTKCIFILQKLDDSELETQGTKNTFDVTQKQGRASFFFSFWVLPKLSQEHLGDGPVDKVLIMQI